MGRKRRPEKEAKATSSLSITTLVVVGVACVMGGLWLRPTVTAPNAELSTEEKGHLLQEIADGPVEKEAPVPAELEALRHDFEARYPQR